MHFRIRTKTLAVAAASVALVAVLAGCSTTSDSATSASSAKGTFAQDSNTLVFSSLPSEDGSDPNGAMEQYIAKETGLKTKYLPTTSYTSLIAAVLAGKVDIAAGWGAASYTTAVAKGAKIDMIAAQYSEPGQTTPGYYSGAIVATKNASKYQTVSQFKGKKICFVDPTSTSGFFFPLLALKAAGIDVTPTGTDASGNPTFKDFTAYFAGSHPKSVQSVANGQCDVGFADDEAYGVKNSGVVTVKDAKTTGDGLGVQLVPGAPVTISSTLPAALKTKLTKLLANLTPDQVKAAGIAVPASEDFLGQKAENSSFYKQIADGCKDPSISKAASAVCG
ncbi:phosphate/phosphite/phosphonate ABC transporter substrate-binding protein [Gryllotalpicola reticulitermitis]|uniref:Phosphate/phosphite/phosphonate ABC transporter substrate-binding protein n=1 Tax=Gryllotalpicola reticulitermitis TaxID=1184153 RepID=A0ABV8Q5W3_9MICO